MNRTEFLETLELQLAGQMQDNKASVHLRYYRNYIEEQLKKGRSEEEILTELGDPRLIAKTLLDTDPEAGQGIYESSSYENGGESSYGYGGAGSYGNSRQPCEESAYDDSPYGDSPYGDSPYSDSPYGRGPHRQEKHRSYHLDLTSWYGKLIVIAAAALIIAGLIFLIGTVLPIIIIAALILSFISWIRRRR